MSGQPPAPRVILITDDPALAQRLRAEARKRGLDIGVTLGTPDDLARPMTSPGVHSLQEAVQSLIDAARADGPMPISPETLSLRLHPRPELDLEYIAGRFNAQTVLNHAQLDRERPRAQLPQRRPWATSGRRKR